MIGKPADAHDKTYTTRWTIGVAYAHQAEAVAAPLSDANGCWLYFDTPQAADDLGHVLELLTNGAVITITVDANHWGVSTGDVNGDDYTTEPCPEFFHWEGLK